MCQSSVYLSNSCNIVFGCSAWNGTKIDELLFAHWYNWCWLPILDNLFVLSPVWIYYFAKHNCCKEVELKYLALILFIINLDCTSFVALAQLLGLSIETGYSEMTLPDLWPNVLSPQRWDQAFKFWEANYISQMSNDTQSLQKRTSIKRTGI